MSFFPSNKKQSKLPHMSNTKNKTKKVRKSGGEQGDKTNKNLQILKKRRLANTYMKMLFLEQKKKENYRKNIATNKRKYQDEQNLVRYNKAKARKDRGDHNRPQNNYINQYKPRPIEGAVVPQEAGIKWSGFNDTKTKTLYKSINGRNVNNRLPPRQNQINEANRYDLKYGIKGQEQYDPHGIERQGQFGFYLKKKNTGSKKKTKRKTDIKNNLNPKMSTPLQNNTSILHMSANANDMGESIL